MRRGKKSEKKHSSLDAILISALIILPVLIIYTIIHFAGPQWDIIVRYLNGHTLLDFLSGGQSLQVAFGGEFSNNLAYYFEPYREPVSTPIFALLSLFFGKSILAYILLVYLCYIFTVCKLSDVLGIDRMVSLAVFTNTYAIFFFFVPNGGEGLSIIFALLALAYLIRKNPLSGLFFGLSALSKYPALILFPLVFFLGDRKKTLQALALELFPILLWGAFDYAAYGVPFYSFIQSAYASLVANGASGASLAALLQVLIYPLVFGIIGAIFFIRRGAKPSLKTDPTSRILIAAIALAEIGYLLVISHNDPTTQARYGYLFHGLLLVPAAIVLGLAVRGSERTRYLIVGGMVLVLAYALFTTYTENNTYQITYYNVDNGNSIYAHAGNVMANLGFGNCRFTSNAWPMMIYAGYNTYSPFVLYNTLIAVPTIERILASMGFGDLNSTINSIQNNYSSSSGLNYSAYVKEQSRYPVAFFKEIGVPLADVLNLNGSRIAYNDQNMTVYLPKNVACYAS